MPTDFWLWQKRMCDHRYVT